jgi:hypothetical protein
MIAGHRIAAGLSERLGHFSCWYKVDLLLGSRLPVAAKTGSAGLPAGCRVDLPVHAGLYTNKKNALIQLQRRQDLRSQLAHAACS